MSIEAYKWAKAWAFPLSSEKFVLLALADYYNDEKRRAWPSMERISQYTCLSRATIARSIDALKKAGFVEVERWVNSETNNNLNNRYYLPMFDSKSTTLGGTVFADVYTGHDGKRIEEPWPVVEVQPVVAAPDLFAWTGENPF